MAKCIIIGAGEFTESALPLEPGDFLVAADGGLRYVEALGLAPDYVIGDFDSLGYIPAAAKDKEAPGKTPAAANGTALPGGSPVQRECVADAEGSKPSFSVCKLPVDKARSDLQEAVLAGIDRGYTRFRIYGGCGGRLDHTLANIQLLAQLAGRGMEAILFEQHQKLQMLKGPGSLTIQKGAGGGLSVFAYSPVCRGVTERGVKYAMQEYVPDGVFTNDYPTGLSNEFTEDTAVIGVEEGILLIVSDR